MNQNYEYFLEQDLSSYAGDWVIIVKEQVKAHGPSSRMKDMVQKVKLEYPGESILITKIPSKIQQIL